MKHGVYIRHLLLLEAVQFINRFFVKMFNTNNIEIVKCCQQEFCFSLPSVTLARRTDFLGKIRQCENLLVKRLLRM